MAPPTRHVDDTDKPTSVVLLGIALAGAAATVGVSLLLGS